jgi:Protein of unknown function (DUF2878)
MIWWRRLSSVPTEFCSPAVKLFLALCALAVAVAVIALFYRENAIIFCILGVAAFVALQLAGWQASAVVPFTVGMVLGPGMEVILIRAGAWTYADPSFAGIPVWLPLLWALTALALTRMSRWVGLLFAAFL